MGINLEILGWTARGFRCPDHSVDFARDDDTVYLVTLLQMPNGTGKTTTLALLRAALSGTASVLGDASAIRDFRGRYTHSNEATFELRLRYGSDGTSQKFLTIRLLFDFDLPEVRFQTAFGSGMENTFRVPSELRPFLNERFVNFFVFDGELAERLLDRGENEASQVVDRLFELENLETVRARVLEHWQELARKTGAAEQKGLNQRRKRVDDLDARYEYLVAQKQANEADLAEVVKRLDIQRQRFSLTLAQRTESRELHQEVQRKLASAETEVRSLNAEFFRVARNPSTLSASFAGQILGLKNSLDRVKLPESTAREFFWELAQEPHCICGRPLDDETRTALLVRSEMYLGSEDSGLLNLIKEQIASSIGTDLDDGKRRLGSTTDALAEKVREVQLLKTELDRIAAEGIAGDPELEKAHSLISTLEQRKRELEVKIERFANPDAQSNDKDTFGIEVIDSRRKAARRKLAEVTDTLEAKKRSDVLRTILAKARQKANQLICEDLIASANHRITQLIPDNHLRIESIRQSLVLQGQAGGSVGENLSVAYAFLSTLFNNASQRLPFVVDSPAGSIDLAVRGRVANLIPDLTGQFVAFVISSERNGFIQPLVSRLPDDSVQFYTLFRKGNADRDATVASFEHTGETDGLCVMGKEYFESFQEGA